MKDKVLQIIKKYQKYKQLEFDEEQDYLFNYGDEWGALLYSQIFCPQFIEVEGSILNPFSCGYSEAKLRFIEYKEEVGVKVAERNFNNFYAEYFFNGGVWFEYWDEGKLLVERIIKSWKGILKLEYPDKNFKFEIYPDEGNGDGVVFTFYEIRD